ncbi:his Kinase A (Phosphoacceptor) domain./Histidine kinase-DNA gyrase B-and HSP90-like ATPase./Response regulator receiver domain [Clostridium sp. CAG:628]|nr:his Kinase A (Phosphoacceptor) domain./Histidine kinase-DNA gyrase B-and HSP90-like ATPase./Response regulator receiver domain [Clostridium sp. CAG:628]
MSIVSFSICSFIFVLMFIIFYFSKERLNTLDTKMYSCILVTNIIGIMIDVFGYFIFKIYGSESFISILISKFYLVYYFLWAYFFLLYIFVISFREKTEYLLQKKFTKPSIILTSIIISLIVLIMPIQITYEDNVAYSSGLSVNMVYGLCFIMVGIMLYCLLRNLKKISTKEYIPLLTFMVLSTFCMIIQKTYPEITLMLMCHSIVTSLMYFTIENPDVKMVKELEVAKNEAEKANHAKSEFLSSMSHELRTPLNAIVCFSELLESKEGLDSESKDFAKDIVSASHNLLDLVNGVLDISKIEAGKMELINKEYNSQELFNSLSTMVIPRIGDKPIDFKTVIASDIPPVLKGDTGKLKQIILNLLTNAVKYTDKGFIKYRVECINDFKNNKTKLIITITDTGRGIKKEDIDRLFKKFERLEEDRNTSIEGTGLGLAITEGLAELMGGKITVISDYGKGSTFKFVVIQEIVNVELKEESSNITSSDYNTFEGKNALIVDDSKLNLKVAENVLKNFLVTTESVTSGLECLSCVNSKKYDIIFMDIMMPNMSGVEVLRKLRENGVNTPVIALTADAIEGQEEKYMSEGFDGYISKPINKEKLSYVLNKYLGGK